MTIEDLNQKEYDKVKEAHGKLSPNERDALDAISRGFGSRSSNMHWHAHALLEAIGVVKLRRSTSFRFHDVVITQLGLHVIDYQRYFDA